MRKLIASCSAVLIAIAVLGACGGDSDDTANPSDTNPSATTTPDDGNDDGSDNDLAKLYADAEKARFKITYTTESDDTQTYAQDGEGNSVYGDGDSQFFTSSSGSVACDTNSEGEATCTSLPGGSSVSPFLGLFQAGRAYIDVLSEFADSESESVAGRDATCVTFSQDTIEDAGPVAVALASAIKGSAVYCIDKETGVLLSLSTTDENGKTTDSLTVTKFEEPSASDFEPPATPQTIPSVSLPDGVTIPTIPGADQ